MMSEPIYNLDVVKSPRVCGRSLDLFSRILGLPTIGGWILDRIKKGNNIQGGMVAFAITPQPTPGGDDGDDAGEPQPLVPLYYPIHEMRKEEKAMHQQMAKEAPLDIQKLSELDVSKEGEHEFRHWSISDYTSRYLAGTTTPTEVAERFITAIEEMNNTTVVTQMNVKELRLQAAESTKRYQTGKVMGVLDGVLVLVKDELPLAGFAMTYGTSFISDTCSKDIFPILKLKEQGALFVGKTNQHEIGIGTTGFNKTYGVPKNPYGKDGVHYYTGGSSSGSAAAVAIGLVPLAIGGDGGGSIRIPSSLCGIVGLKPTFKRVVFDKLSVAHMGPHTNNIHDAALAYAIMAGETDDDHRHQSQHQPPVHLHAYTAAPNVLKGLRIGVFQEHVNDSDANVLAATKKAMQYYQSKGAEIVQITLPHLNEIHHAHGVIISSEMYSSVQRHCLSSKDFNKFDPETRVSLLIGKSWKSSDFIAAMKVRSYAMSFVEDLFKNKVDLILSPGCSCTAPLFKKDAKTFGESNLGQTSKLMRYAIHGNMTGIPGMVFPIAYDEDTSLPISLQLQAAHWREDLLLGVAKESQGILEKGIAKPTMYVDILGE